ncbi:hypothetical protein Brsp01_42020 [Brucella sp. NBRC 12950]|nr:hypothetical protein Brsp01_42020 [Brucella sp. NBRC 12950]
MGVDISYIWTAEGWLYLAIVVDLYSRRIIGREARDRMKKDLAISALKKAIAIRQPKPGLIQHSDREANMPVMSIAEFSKRTACFHL